MILFCNGVDLRGMILKMYRRNLTNSWSFTIRSLLRALSRLLRKRKYSVHGWTAPNALLVLRSWWLYMKFISSNDREHFTDKEGEAGGPRKFLWHLTCWLIDKVEGINAPIARSMSLVDFMVSTAFTSNQCALRARFIWWDRKISWSTQ